MRRKGQAALIVVFGLGMMGVLAALGFSWFGPKTVIRQKILADSNLAYFAAQSGIEELMIRLTLIASKTDLTVALSKSFVSSWSLLWFPPVQQGALPCLSNSSQYALCTFAQIFSKQWASLKMTN